MTLTRMLMGAVRQQRRHHLVGGSNTFYEYTTDPIPPQGVWQTNPHGGRMMRVQVSPGPSNRIGHYYGASRVFNADATVLFTPFGAEDFWSTDTGVELSSWNNAGLFKWHPTEPTWMWGVGSNQVSIRDVADGGALVKTIAITNPTGAPGGSTPMSTITGSVNTRCDTSMNGRTPMKVANAQGEDCLIGVDFFTDEVIYFGRYQDYGYTVDWLNDPQKDRQAKECVSGKYMMMFGARGFGSYPTPDHLEYHMFDVFDWDTGAHVFKSDSTGTDVQTEAPGGHGDTCLDALGRDVFAGVDKAVGGAVSVALYPGAWGDRTQMSGFPVSHASGNAYLLPGWMVSCSWGSGTSSAVVAWKVDGSGFKYLADSHNHSPNNSYAEGKSSVSHDGRYVAVVSDWGGLNSAQGDCYLLDLAPV